MGVGGGLQPLLSFFFTTKKHGIGFSTGYTTLLKSPCTVHVVDKPTLARCLIFQNSILLSRNTETKMKSEYLIRQYKEHQL